MFRENGPDLLNKCIVHCFFMLVNTITNVNKLHLIVKCYHIYIYIYIHSGGKIFDPLLILYICPLTKKLSIYIFNGRFIPCWQSQRSDSCSWPPGLHTSQEGF